MGLLADWQIKKEVKIWKAVIDDLGLKGFLGGEVLFHGAHADRRS